MHTHDLSYQHTLTWRVLKPTELWEEVQKWAERGPEVTNECPIINEEGKTRTPESACVCVILGSISPTILRIYSLSPHSAVLLNPSLHSENVLSGILLRFSVVPSHTQTQTQTGTYTLSVPSTSRQLVLFITRCKVADWKLFLPGRVCMCVCVKRTTETF